MAQGASMACQVHIVRQVLSRGEWHGMRRWPFRSISCVKFCRVGNGTRCVDGLPGPYRASSSVPWGMARGASMACQVHIVRQVLSRGVWHGVCRWPARPISCVKFCPVGNGTGCVDGLPGPYRVSSSVAWGMARGASLAVCTSGGHGGMLRELLLQDRNLQWIKRLGLRYIKRTSRYFISQHAGL
ncbi:uncharacterized protein LOC123395992 isoform X2 [Hordeum vulgare subsp. vulgare]|nr:uncharacterized protein LOC123395992 isoform X2 [Hordeum vulgare subsp. vulgare]